MPPANGLIPSAATVAKIADLDVKDLPTRLPARVKRQQKVWDALVPQGANTTIENALFDRNDPSSNIRLAMLACPTTAKTVQREATNLAARSYDTSDVNDAMARLKHVPFMRADRRTYALNVARVLVQRSSMLQQALRGSYDALVVGSGPHGTQLANTMTRAGRRVLVIDESVFSANFGSTGELFRLNSANRLDDGKVSLGRLGSGYGQLNDAGGAVRVSDLTGMRWPYADILGDSVIVNLFETGADTLLGVKALSAQRTQNGSNVGKYEMALWSRDQQQVLSARADVIIAATGPGEPKITIADEVGGKLLRDAFDVFTTFTYLPVLQAEKKFSDLDPGIRTVEQAFRIAKAQQDPLAPYREPFAVVGFGDSAKTFMEFVFGLANPSAYDGPNKSSAAQRGTTTAAYWFVNDGPGTCEEYASKSRARYAELAGPAKQKLQFKTAQVTGIVKGDGGYVIGSNDGSETVVRRLVWAGGFNTTTLSLVAPLLSADILDANKPLEQTDKLEAVEVFAYDRPLRVAQKLKDEDVYVMGIAAAGGPNALVPDSEKANIPQNGVSLANLMPRTAAAAQEVVKRLSAARSDVREGNELTVEPLVLEGQPRVEESMTVAVDDNAFPVPQEALKTTIHASINEMLTGSCIPGDVKTLTLGFRFHEDNKLVVDSVGLTANGLQALCTKLSEMSQLVASISAYTQDGNSLSFRFPVDQGWIDVASPTVSEG